MAVSTPVPEAHSLRSVLTPRSGTGFIRGYYLLLVLGAVAILLAPMHIARAAPLASYYVDASTGNDTNSCMTMAAPCKSITQAVSLATSSGDVIHIATGTYSVAATGEVFPITIDNVTLTLVGANASTTIVSGGGTINLFNPQNATVTLSRMTLQDGYTTCCGGAIAWSTPSTIVLQNMILSNNYGGGAAIYQGGSGTLTISDSQFLTNTTGSFCCGAIYSTAGSLNLSNTSFISNSSTSGGAIFTSGSSLSITGGQFISNTTASGDGGAILADGPSTTIIGTTFTNNSAGSVAGAIDLFNGAVFTISNSSFSGNSAVGRGGAVDVNCGSCTLAISNTNFDSNTSNASGGALSSLSSAGVTIIASTFSNNRAVNVDGGALWANITTTITNSTFYSNSAVTGFGGGIFVNHGTTSLTNATLSRNSAGAPGQGGGVYRDGASVAVVLRNTIAANSLVGGNCGGSITNDGNNIDSGTTCGWVSVFGSMSNTDPKLAPFANLGGPTKVLGLLLGSPAIDGVTFASPNSAPSTDQRGFPRPIGGGYDIGAFEGTAYPLYLPLIMK